MTTADVWLDVWRWQPIAAALVDMLQLLSRASHSRFQRERLCNDIKRGLPMALRGVIEGVHMILDNAVPPECKCEKCRLHYMLPRFALSVRPDVRAAVVQAVLAELEAMKS